MRKITTLFLLSVLMMDVAAQKADKLSGMNMGELNAYKEDAVRLKNTGIILTAAGSTVAVTGFMLLMNYFEKTVGDPEYNRVPENIYGFTMLAGLISTAIGVPLWIIGGERERHAEIALKKFDIKKPDSAIAFGLGVTIRF